MLSIIGIKVKDKVRLSEIIEHTGASDIGWRVKISGAGSASEERYFGT